MFCINGNMGNMYLITSDGLFVSTLFHDIRLRPNWAAPVASRNMDVTDVSLHDENFWPSITQTADGRVFVVDGGRTSLVRVDGLDTTVMKPKTSVINSMLTAFDDLKIVGVRKKPDGLSANLSASDTLKVTEADLGSLGSRGFYYIPGKGLLSNEGELIVSTFNGVTYVLRFGSVFTGTDIEVEVGGAAEGTKTETATKTDDAAEKELERLQTVLDWHMEKRGEKSGCCKNSNEKKSKLSLKS